MRSRPRKHRMHGVQSCRIDRAHTKSFRAARARSMDVTTRRSRMNSDQIHGHWREVKGWALEQVGRVTHDQWNRLAGRRERLLVALEAALPEPRLVAIA